MLALVQGFTEFLPISSSAHLTFPSAIRLGRSRLRLLMWLSTLVLWPQ
ncbi:hypothetical protein O9993_20040 [Vibrio lentus]|nr:hypothetical protein [Vibrio lentus]